MSLVLYKKDSCPFCRKVMSFLDANEIEVERKDIVEDPANLTYLIEHGGKNQVPCLFIDGEPLYESDDIIEYFKQNYLKGEAKEAEPEGSGSCPIE